MHIDVIDVLNDLVDDRRVRSENLVREALVGACDLERVVVRDILLDLLRVVGGERLQGLSKH